MIFYAFFLFWEVSLRMLLNIILFGLAAFRLMFLITLPFIVLLVSMIVVAKIAFRLYRVKCDENRSVEEIVTSRGFMFENHHVTTADGYVLQMFRVMNPYVSDSEREKKPVLLMHGLGTNGVFWLLNDEFESDWRRLINPDDELFKHSEKPSKKFLQSKYNKTSNALAFELASSGFDVWIGHQRGSMFGTKHSIYKKEQKEFWNFTLDEIAMFDLPAQISHVLRVTDQEKLSYVGMSQGATAMLALMTTQEKYNDIIRPFIAMAPVVKTKDSFMIKGLGNFLRKRLVSLAMRYPGTMSPRLVEFLVQLFLCNHSLESLSNPVGRQLLVASNHLDVKKVSTYCAYLGAHMSRKNAAHYIQMCDGEFAHFDYGPKENVQKYGMKEPLPYPLEKITCKTLCIIYSQDDSVATPSNVRYLMSKLRVQPLNVYFIKKKKWGHQDFQLGKDCGTVVNERIMLLLRVSNEPASSQLPESSCSYFSLPSVRAVSTSTNLTEVTSNISPKIGRETISHSFSSSSSSSFEWVNDRNISDDEDDGGCLIPLDEQLERSGFPRKRHIE